MRDDVSDGIKHHITRFLSYFVLALCCCPVYRPCAACCPDLDAYVYVHQGAQVRQNHGAQAHAWPGPKAVSGRSAVCPSSSRLS